MIKRCSGCGVYLHLEDFYLCISCRFIKDMNDRQIDPELTNRIWDTICEMERAGICNADIMTREVVDMVDRGRCTLPEGRIPRVVKNPVDNDLRFPVIR